MIIKHKNIIYIKDLSEIGGVETFVYEIIKKYHKLDIAVVYKTADDTQLNRLHEFCPTYKHTNQDIDCEVAIINYDTSIINYLPEKIYKDNASEKQGIYQVIHGDYENPVYKWKPPTDKRIKYYIGITQYIVDSFKRITGNENVILGYNPLTIDKKSIMLISMTRLSKIKGKDRMKKLADALDLAGVDYIWYVFTNDEKKIDNANIFYMKPNLNVYKWLCHADYLVQLSDTEACSYSINEALYRNIPVICTKLPYLEEIGVKDGVNAYLMDYDCSNIDYIVDNINNIPKFKFNHLPENYDEILAKSESSYNDNEKMIKVKVTEYFSFGRFKKLKNIIRKNDYNNCYGCLYEGDIFECNYSIFEYLSGNNPKNKSVIIEYKKGEN